jgi:hypothetical protein
VGILYGVEWIIMNTIKWFLGINPGIQHMKGSYPEAAGKAITFVLINCTPENPFAIARLPKDGGGYANI